MPLAGRRVGAAEPDRRHGIYSRDDPVALIPRIAARDVQTYAGSQGGRAQMKNGLVALALLGLPCACSQDPVDRCIDARLKAFDEKNPDGVSKTGKTRAEVERDASLTCLYAANGGRR